MREVHPFEIIPSRYSTMTDSKLKPLPIAAKIVLTTFLLSVGVGFTSALVNLHFQSANAGQVLPGPDETIAEFHGSGHPSQMIRLLTSHEGKPFNGTGSMKSAFTKRRAGGLSKAIRDKQTTLLEQAEEKLKDNPKELEIQKAKLNNKQLIEKLVLEEINGERLALLAWVKDGYQKVHYDESGTTGFPLTGGLKNIPITSQFVHVSEDGKNKYANIQGIIESRCVRCHDEGIGGSASSFPLSTYEMFMEYCIDDNSDAKSLDKLALTSHVHLLGFATLYGLTGLCLAFSGYPVPVRVLLAPGALVLQVIEISCWWLARMESPLGPAFAMAIPPLGGLVAFCLMAQITLSIWDMYDSTGRKVAIGLLVGAGLIFALLAVKIVVPFLKEESGIIVPDSSGRIKSTLIPRIAPSQPANP